MRWLKGRMANALALLRFLVALINPAELVLMLRQAAKFIQVRMPCLIYSAYFVFPDAQRRGCGLRPLLDQHPLAVHRTLKLRCPLGSVIAALCALFDGIMMEAEGCRSYDGCSVCYDCLTAM